MQSAGNSEDCSHFFMKLAGIVLNPRIDCYEKYFPISVKESFKIPYHYYLLNFLLRKDGDHIFRSVEKS